MLSRLSRRILLLPLLLALAAPGCGKKDQETAESPESPAGASDHTGDLAATTGGSMTPETPDAPKSGAAAAGMNPILDRSLKNNPGPEDEIAVVRTNMGTFTIRFFPKQANRTVANFKGLAAKGYYNGTTFHRVIDGFMIQGGDPTATGSGGQSLWGAEFEDEFDPGLRFTGEGIVAMANAGPRTNGSQFFITLGPTPHLNDKHTIFGEILEGMDVVRAIGKVQTGAGDKPATAVVMESVTIEIRGS